MLFGKKKSITGLFVEKNGCGFTHSQTYDIGIRVYDNKIWILDTKSNASEPSNSTMALSFLSYNLRRTIKILGVGVLIARIKQRKRKTEG